MKLNPKKCSFGVEKGPFLGHLITKKGIKANPSKVKAVTDLDQPRTLKDIQSLNGKLAALSQFLSKCVERSLAFFKVLKGCKYKKSIQWTTKADKGLEEIKKLVQTLPTLTAPRGVVKLLVEVPYDNRNKNLLKLNADVFAWTHADMTRILRTIMVEGKPFNTEHKLNEYSHVKPIKQNKRDLGPDRNMAACKETEELMKAGILWKVKHQTWVSNPVMVKKSDGGWRMCVDFTDINKACPKDCYPLPEIDWKIESISGFRLKCF
ncbi:hypothetical protein Tco_0938581 [Tanacetum coccineum]|uniref:Reverse transcriptase domain-containing protein n=1 Tax=Tanacetum coccineum TaxID=301880 RepID=A0ABQ5DK98_9ASTR